MRSWSWLRCVLVLVALTLGCAPSTERDERVGRTQSAAIGDCTVNMSLSPSGASSIGSTVTITGFASCIGGAAAEYKFFVRSPSGVWTLLRDWATGSSHPWNTTGAAAGDWAIQVWARRVGSTDAYEGYDYRLAYPLIAGEVCKVGSFGVGRDDWSTTVTVSASATACTNPRFKFYKKNAAGGWDMFRDWNTSGTFTYNGAGDAPGVHLFEVWVRNEGSPALFEDSKTASYTVAAPTCNSTTLTTPTTSGPAGTSVVFTASANCSGTTEYKFFRRELDGSWTVVRDYATGNTYTWDSTGAAVGTYTFQVWVRPVGNTSAFLDASSNVSYTITSASAACTAATISASPSGGAEIGAFVDVTATATCGTGTIPHYKFYLRHPSGTWTVMQNYSATNGFTWSTADYPAGTYTLQVWARAPGSTAAWEAVANMPGYELRTPGTGTCTTATLTAAAPSPQPIGATIALTATATCSGGATPVFKLWVQNPTGEWRVGRDWGSGSIAWDTMSFKPLVAGNYNVQVWTRAAASTAAYEGFASIFDYQLTGCTTVTIKADLPSPQNVGTIVPVTATATCVGGVTPQYRFATRSSSGTITWSAWTTSATTTWNTTGYVAGTHNGVISVRTRAVGSPVPEWEYEGSAVLGNFTLN